MKKSYRILVAFARLAAFALLCSPQSAKATILGSPVPKPTAVNQYPVSAPYAGGFVWTPVTLPWVTNGSQTAFGGAIDTTSRLSVNPQGTSENGLTVRMPVAASGSALTVFNSNSVAEFQMKDVGGGIWALVMPNLNSVRCSFTNGTTADVAQIYSDNVCYFGPYTDKAGGSNGEITQIRYGRTLGAGNAVILDGQTQTLSVPLAQTNTAASASAIPLTLKSQSGQTADLLDLNDSTNATKAKVDKNFVMTAKGFASSVRVVTGADTATLSDSVLLCNGTFTQTLPATGWPTGYRLTVKDTGTGTITLTAGGTITFDGATTLTFATQYKSRVLIWDGANFQIESGLL